MILNDYGRIVEEEWLRTPVIRPTTALDEWQVMPNHFHAIVWITKPPVGACREPSGCRTPKTEQRGMGLPPQSLASLANGFKGAVKRGVNALRAEQNRAPVEVWQRGFYEHIVRDEEDLERIRRYIRENPMHWETDENNPNSSNPP